MAAAKAWANVSATTNALQPSCCTGHKTSSFCYYAVLPRRCGQNPSNPGGAVSFADVKMPVNRCHHTSQVCLKCAQVCSSVRKGLWLACPAVKKGCGKSRTRTADREDVRQLLFRDSLYRCSRSVIHESLKAEKQRSRNETPK